MVHRRDVPVVGRADPLPLRQVRHPEEPQRTSWATTRCPATTTPTRVRTGTGTTTSPWSTRRLGRPRTSAGSPDGLHRRRPGRHRRRSPTARSTTSTCRRRPAPAFAGTSVKWNDFFGLNGETLLSGDFNGDGKRRHRRVHPRHLGRRVRGTVHRHRFAGATKWHDWFAPGAEVAGGRRRQRRRQGRHHHLHPRRRTRTCTWRCPPGPRFGRGTQVARVLLDRRRVPGGRRLQRRRQGRHHHLHPGPATAADVIVALSNGTGFGASAEVARPVRGRHRAAATSGTSTATARTTSSRSPATPTPTSTWPSPTAPRSSAPP